MGFINNIIEFFKKFFAEQSEYERTKQLKRQYAFNDFYFWEKLEIPCYKINKEYLKNWLCPYCNKNLEPKKGKTFKCPHCKEKIFKTREIKTKEEGLFTTTQKQELKLLFNEYNKRIKFIEKYQYIDKILSVNASLQVIGNLARYHYTNDKMKNIETLIFYLHLGIPDFYKKQNLNKLRECRFFEGYFQNTYGTIQQATNAFMTVLYIDLMGEYCTLYDDKDYTKKELKEDGFKEWNHAFIAPAIFGFAFEEDLPIEKFKEIFLFNANCLIKQLQFTPPITPEKAWQKILEYREKN